MNTVARIDQQQLIPFVELNITARPAQVLGNFSQVKAWLTQELERFDVVVTEDTLVDAKKLAADLNKYASDFDKRRKDTTERLNQPVKLLEANVKELVKMCKAGRLKLTDQIDRFEDQRKAEILVQIVTHRDREWERLEVQLEFRTALVDDLAKLTAITKAGNLTAVTITEIGHRVGADKQRQDRQRLRLLQLETESSRAGLSVPLSREHVQHFLAVDDDGIYLEQLARVIRVEKGRQEQAEAALRAKIHNEQLAAQAAAEPVPAEVVQDMVALRLRPERKPELVMQPTKAQSPAANWLEQKLCRFAVGPLSDHAKAKLVVGTLEDAERAALTAGDASTATVYGLWTPDRTLPIALIYGGEIYRI